MAVHFVLHQTSIKALKLSFYRFAVFESRCKQLSHAGEDQQITQLRKPPENKFKDRQEKAL